MLCWRPRAKPHPVDPTYVAITDFANSSLTECRKADKRNATIRKERARLIMDSPDFVLFDDDAPVHNSNVKAYMAWLQANRLVRADLQAMATEVLVKNNMHLARGDYEAHNIIEETTPGPPLPVEFDDNPPGYNLLSCDELVKTSKAKCLVIDARNQNKYFNMRRRSSSVNGRLQTAQWAVRRQGSAAPPRNAERKAMLEDRMALVSAIEQSRAVEALYAMDMYCGIHYEPQMAISTAKRLMEAHHRHTPPPPAYVTPSAPPMMYPELPPEGSFQYATPIPPPAPLEEIQVIV